MSDQRRGSVAAQAHDGAVAPNTEATAKAPLSRRDYLKNAALGVAAGGAATLGMPAIAKAQNKTWSLKLQSNWTGIGIESQDRAVKLFVERVNKMSGGRIK